MNKKRILIIAVTLLLTIANFTRLKGNENIRPIQFILVFVIGALSDLSITEFAILFRIKKQ